MTYEHPQQSSALDFARALKQWFRTNNWPQKVTDDWARSVGSITGPWASQMCGAMQGNGYNPKAEFFLALGRFNRAVADNDLKNVTDRKCRDRMTAGDPFVHDDGLPFSSTDFWAMYAGELPVPDQYTAPRQLTDVEASHFGHEAKRLFNQSVENFGAAINPTLHAWGAIRMKLTDQYDENFLNKLAAVVGRLAAFTGSELTSEDTTIILSAVNVSPKKS